MSKYVCFLVALTSLCFASDSLDKAKSFQLWLKNNEASFADCRIGENEKNYILCDKTHVPKKELTKLFKMEAEELIDYIRSQGVSVEVFCSSKKIKTFQKCEANKKREGFRKNKNLEGQFKPLESTILLRSHANRGSLIHEYIHYLQYKNKNQVYGRQYKSERVKIEQDLVSKMDQIIVNAQEAEKKGADKSKLNKAIKEMVIYSRTLKDFGKWQDLIDERSIFMLYLQHGKEFGVREEDIKLASKNMGFICANKEFKYLEKKLECKNTIKITSSEYKEAIISVIEEIRPKSEAQKGVKEVMTFWNSLPEKTNTSLENNIKILSEYIFKQLKINADNSIESRKNKDNILADSVLKNKTGHCVGLSSLYLMAAQKWGIKAYLVRIPEHVFPRFCDEKKCIDIETLMKGRITNKTFYLDNGYMTEKEIKDTTYYTSLEGGKKLKSSLYLSLGYIASKSEQYPLSEFFYKKSIDNDRSFAEGYLNLASVYGKIGNKRQAKLYLAIAEKINEKHIPTLINKSIIQWEQGEKENALNTLTIAQGINSFNTLIYSTRAEFMRADKKTQKEFENLLMISNIKPKHCTNHKKIVDLKPKINLKSLEKEYKFVETAIKKNCK